MVSDSNIKLLLLRILESSLASIPALLDLQCQLRNDVDDSCPHWPREIRESRLNWPEKFAQGVAGSLVAGT